MLFQFYCPEGHLLQGDDAQAGQSFRCPYCGLQFVMPRPASAATQPEPGPPEPTDAELNMDNESPALNPFDPAFARADEEFHLPIFDASPRADAVTEVAEAEAAQETPAAEPDAAEQLSMEPSLVEAESPSDKLHIPCPSGHVLETPRELVGRDALCPICQTQFVLRFEKSLEYRKQRTQKQAERDQQLGAFWMNIAIVAAIAVVAGIILLAGALALR